MKNRGFVVLAAVTFALVAGAAGLMWQESGSSQPELMQEIPLLPDLAVHADQITSIDIGDTIHLRRQGDGWILPQKSNFPADPAAVASLLSTLGHMKPIEEKTSDPVRYHELGLAEPGKEGAGTPVRLSDTDGKELATVVIGRTAPSLGRVGGGTYVRTGGDARTWLVEGVIRAPADAMALADTSLFGLTDPKTIRSVTVQAGKSSFILARSKPDDAFAVVGSDAHPDAGKANQLAGLAIALNFQDVRPAGTDKIQKTLTFKSFDGAGYILQLTQIDKQLWVRANEDGPNAKPFNDSHAAFAYRLPDYLIDTVKLTPDALSGAAHSAGAHK